MNPPILQYSSAREIIFRFIFAPYICLDPQATAAFKESASPASNQKPIQPIPAGQQSTQRKKTSRKIKVEEDSKGD